MWHTKRRDSRNNAIFYAGRLLCQQRLPQTLNVLLASGNAADAWLGRSGGVAVCPLAQLSASDLGPLIGIPKFGVISSRPQRNAPSGIPVGRDPVARRLMLIEKETDKETKMGRNQLRTIGSATAVLIAATALAACGSSSSTDTTAAPAAMTTAAATTEASSASTKVDVVLNEMNVMAMPGEAKAGDVTFDVKNEGAGEHNLIVIKTDKMAADLGQGAEVSEAGKVGKVDSLAAGESKDLTLDLAAGHYALICNLAGHYGAGMYQDFNVN
jgi:uncharacterized cupredoxin-like copper-binding protein